MDRRSFLRHSGAGAAAAVLGSVVRGVPTERDSDAAALPSGWVDPPREFSLAPFWFWNDDLSQAEIVRQMNLVTQMGAQGTVHTGLRRNVALIRAGAVGAVKEIHAWTHRPTWPQGLPRPRPVPVPKHLK